MSDPAALMADAATLLESVVISDRVAGWQAIGDICNGHPETVAVVWPLARATIARESSVEVLAMALWALQMMTTPEVCDQALALILAHAASTSPALRLAVAQAIPSCAGDPADPQATRALIRLTADECGDIRNWATFGLGRLSNLDTPEIREVLAAHLDDAHDETRNEALIGLARRADERAIASAIRELTADSVGVLAVHAAALLGDARLHPTLLELRDWWDVDPDLLEEAIRRCDPHGQPTDLGHFESYEDYMFFTFGPGKDYVAGN